MFRSSLASLLLSAAGLSPLATPATWAQTAAFPKSDPADAGVSVPPVVYNSPFVPYRAFAEQEVAPWKETNDTAGRIGGWRAYAREARPESGNSEAPPGAVKPVPAELPKPPGSHGDHQMKQGGRRE